MYLSIVILNYFSKDKVGKLISTIKPQNFSGEIIIVDNSEDSKELSDLQKLEFINNDICCRVIDSGGNNGFSAGTNCGIKSISSLSTHVFILNPDTVLIDDALSYVMKLIEVLPDVVISPRGIRMDDQSDWSFGGKLHILRGRCDVDSRIKSYTLTSAFGTCASLIVPVKFLNEFGLLDEDFFLGGEEWELSVRLRRKSIYILTPSDVLYQHEISGTHKKYGLPFLYMGHRTKVLFMAKCFRYIFPLWFPYYLICMPFLVFKYTLKNDLRYFKSISLVFKAVVRSALKMRITKDEFFSIGDIK